MNHVFINLLLVILLCEYQVYEDVEDLLRHLQEGTSDECCFDNHNITTGSLVFETQGDTVAMAEPFFVRQLSDYRHTCAVILMNDRNVNILGHGNT